MPPSVRVLDTALQHSNAQDRLQVLKTALAGGSGDLPGVAMDGLSTTANQFVDDMEDQQVLSCSMTCSIATSSTGQM